MSSLWDSLNNVGSGSSSVNVVIHSSGSDISMLDLVESLKIIDSSLVLSKSMWGNAQTSLTPVWDNVSDSWHGFNDVHAGGESVNVISHNWLGDVSTLSEAVGGGSTSVIIVLGCLLDAWESLDDVLA